MQTPGGRRRGRLVRHYFLISAVLIGGGLITSGAVEMYYRYRESLENLTQLHREVTAGAAFKIERFIQEIERTLRATTRSREIAQRGLSPEYKFELERLLIVARAITEAVAFDLRGTERLRVSRFRTIGSQVQAEPSGSQVFQRTRQGHSYFGPVYFVRGSEPYMTIAVPIERFAGDVIGALQAEVNLKYVWEVVSGIKVGKAGYAYAVSRGGDLIAHPDISLVLQRRNVANLDQVKGAFQTPPGSTKAQGEVRQSLDGRKVFTSSAVIPSLDWAVFIEQPVEEAHGPMYASMLRTTGLLLLGLGMAALAGLFVARRVVRPLGTLREGVERIGRGDLSSRLDVKTGDEIEMLADQFNNMTARLQESHAGLERKVEERTRDLTETLGQQTATSEILQVMAGSPTNLSPVLDAIAENAARVCAAQDAVIRLVEGDVLRLAAHHGPLELGDSELPIDQRSVVGRAMVQRQLVHVNDLLSVTGTEYPTTRATTELYGVRTALAAPLLRRGVPIGVIFVRRGIVDPFTEKQIAMLKTFAAQAVIAIENVRLFRELQARTRELAYSVEELKGLGEVSQAVSSTLDLETVLTTIVTHAVQLSGSSGGNIYEYDEAGRVFHLRATYRMEEEMIEALGATPIGLGEGAVGKAASLRAPVQVPDLTAEPGLLLPRVRSLLARLGYRSVMAVPLLREERIVGGLVAWRQEAGSFSDGVVNLLQTFAAQSVLAIQNAHLFREIEEKRRELEMADRHKSQFLANVSHELRTPLNAILGFTRLVLRRTEGQIPELQRENLQKVQISAEHLLRLINGLLDLSKIEAGKMEVFAEPFRIDEVLQEAVSTVEPMLKNGHVRFVHEVAPDLPILNTDREKLKQIILNLLSNATKFTEEGEVRVSVLQENGFLKLSVSDTGIGIEPEALQYIFEEFRQDRSGAKRYGGTGLGLAIVKRLVALLGGEIAVESRVGKGSTFTVTVPISLK